MAGPGGIPIYVDEKFSYGGEVYSDKEEALAAVKTGQDRLVAGTAVTGNRVGGTLYVYIPDKRAILQRGFKTAKPPSRDGKDFLGESSALQLQAFYAAAVKRGSFDQVILRYSAGEHIDPRPGERVVYRHLSGPSVGQWYFSSDAVTRAPVSFGSAPQPAERIRSWLESLDALAKK